MKPEIQEGLLMFLETLAQEHNVRELAFAEFLRDYEYATDEEIAAAENLFLDFDREWEQWVNKGRLSEVEEIMAQDLEGYAATAAQILKSIKEMD